MIYEVYRQEAEQTDVISKKVTRYHTENKKIAFYFMNEKNKIEQKNVWRVAICIDNRVCFDIDKLDINNLKNIYNYYSKQFTTKFRIIKTLNGYHLISVKQYKDNLEWQYDECRILYPFLEKENMQKYIEACQRFYRESSRKQRITGQKKEDFLNELSNEFKQSGLYFGVGDFDILFSMNVLFRGKHCIRISKKCKEDKPEEIQI